MSPIRQSNLLNNRYCSMLRFFILLLLTAACTKTPEPSIPPVVPVPPLISTEADLFRISNYDSTFYWYQNSNVRLTSANASAHSPFMRVRYNSIAAAVLSDNGKLPVNGIFPRGSLIVKELFESETDTLRYLAVMYKDSLHPQQAFGWVWGEYEVNGTPLITLNSRGNICTSCHQSNSRDMTRLFDLHP